MFKYSLSITGLFLLPTLHEVCSRQVSRSAGTLQMYRHLHVGLFVVVIGISGSGIIKRTVASTSTYPICQISLIDFQLYFDDKVQVPL